MTVGLERDDGELVVRVEDDGPGIPPDERERLLEPFARGADARPDGTGLGLAIVAQQAALHGGELRLGDAPGGGSPSRSAARERGRGLGSDGARRQIRGE